MVLALLVAFAGGVIAHRATRARRAPSFAVRARPASEPGARPAAHAALRTGAAEPAAEVNPCLATIARLESEPGLPGAPELEARRSETLLRAKAHPVLFVRAPSPAGIPAEADALRRSILEASKPLRALYDAYPKLAKRRDLARHVLLTQGYLYTSAPWFAAALVNLVRPEDLFHEPELFLARGDAIVRLVRKSAEGGSVYVYGEGPEEGARVKLLLFDRIATTRSALDGPLHRDVVDIAEELGFDEMRVRKLTERAVAADLRYGDVWVPTVLDAHDARLSLGCEAPPPGSAAKIRTARDLSRRRAKLLARLRAVMDEEVAEALPFDEPKTEVGQQDGKLRQHWSWAYRFGRNDFEFNDDRYRVFDDKGRPRVPQVCIDFVTDTFERAGGSWYRARGEPRERIRGRLDFAALGIDNERSVERFVDFAKAHPEWFEVLELPEEERVPYARRAEFFRELVRHPDRYRPGDVVTIYGLRDDGKMHYHSFIVYSADPVTGAPSLVAANAGRPRIRPWESEMVSAPERSVTARIRPRLEWLESVIVLEAESEPVAVARASSI